MFAPSAENGGIEVGGIFDWFKVLVLRFLIQSRKHPGSKTITRASVETS